MCGVIGVCVEREKDDLGELAGRLLKMLEYRGYDSTGALFQDAAGKTTLLKDVGAPSKLVKSLGIDKQKGRVFCGQVRWATFGAVTKANAQPHEMRCKTHFFGAHNGNITNCEDLKEWLKSEGHDVKSDNDGEMIVHTVEHFFAEELAGKKNASREERTSALHRAAQKAANKAVGSFAACVFDPETQVMAAIKKGSSLYIGVGHDETDGAFVIASSDLGSVLSMTKILLPIAENEFAICTHAGATIYDVRTGQRLERKATRTLLSAFDTQLRAPHKYFMEQEIYSQVEAADKLIRLYTGHSPALDFLRRARTERPTLLEDIRKMTIEAAGVTQARDFREGHKKLVACAPVRELMDMAAAAKVSFPVATFTSTLAGFLDEVRRALPGGNTDGALALIDGVFELFDVDDVERRVNMMMDEIIEARRHGGAVYLLACGTSFHAAKAATFFFNELAGVQVFPLLPGEFRAQTSECLRDGDVIVGISQSGETKDLIDIFNQVRDSGRRVSIITMVNNVNSTMAQEKSKFYIPLSCGPEIAVPATKSFMNQMVLLYYLALRVMDRMDKEGLRARPAEERARRWEQLRSIPALIGDTLRLADGAVDAMADDLFLEPSIHILATRMLGLAQEGALKIREVVLNHTQGYEGSEFKHGPNTILGVNTVFGLENVRAMLAQFSSAVMNAIESEAGKNIGARGVHRLFRAVSDWAFDDVRPTELNEREMELFDAIFEKHNFFGSMYRNYPLMFISGPSERDVNLTVSQINTHKIRGANVYVIAEENATLRKQATLAPANGREYRSGYVPLPKTGDDLLPLFSSAVVLQMLALKMSIKKMNLLNRLEILDHGVHPDAPKNVSKSVTVD